MRKTGLLALGLFLSVSSVALAQSTDNANDMINKLVPSEATPALAPEVETVLTVQTATKNEILGRLGFSASRSLGKAPAPAQLPPFAKGRETELLAALKPLYATLTDQQKIIADEIIRPGPGGPHAFGAPGLGMQMIDHEPMGPPPFERDCKAGDAP